MSSYQHNRTGNRDGKAVRSWWALTFCSLIELGTAGSAVADIVDGELDGFYVPQYGWAVTQEVSRPELGETPRQIGSYSMVLAREGWDDLPAAEKMRVRKLLGIKGSLRGVMDMKTLSVNHTLGTERRDGVLYTEGDFLQPEAGDPYCSEGVPLVGVKTFNFAMGTGSYSTLSGGSIQVYGTINNCASEPEFLQNDFTVIPGAGGVRFESSGGSKASEPIVTQPDTSPVEQVSMQP